jgi:hypothetical protein
MQKVTTYISSSQQTITLCLKCERKYEKNYAWPKDSKGQEFCSVSYGLHYGWCEVCQERQK